MVAEQLPDDPGTFALFFLPNFLGILFAFALEHFSIESFLRDTVLPVDANRYSLLGIGIFAIANVNSYLAGSVVMARISYGVKLPNLYAAKTHVKNATDFNIIQRCHQNFLEQYAQLVLGVIFTAFVAERPITAGVTLIIVSLCRVWYAWGYRRDIKSRTGGILVSMFTSSVGVGYGALVGLSAFGVHVLKTKLL